MSSGEGGGRVECKRRVVSELFEEFKALDKAARGFQGEEGQPIVKLGAKEIRLSRGIMDESGWEYYSRITRMGDGRWVTVQIRELNYGFISDYAVNIFDDKGNRIASADRTSCKTGNLLVSPQDGRLGKDTLIEGALRAATGRSYEVEVK